MADNNPPDKQATEKEFTVDEILAEVRMLREQGKEEEKTSEKSAREKLLSQVDNFLLPRESIDITDIIPEEMLREYGVETVGFKTELDKTEDLDKTESLNKTKSFDTTDDLGKTSVLPLQDESGVFGEETQSKLQSMFAPEKVQERKKKPIERPGVVTKFSDDDAPKDFEPLPILLSADEAQTQIEDDGKTKVHQFIKTGGIAESTENEEEDLQITGQIQFDSFVEEKEPPLQSVSDDAEHELKKRRKEKMKGFRLSDIEPKKEQEKSEVPESKEEKKERKPRKTRKQPEYIEAMTDSVWKERLAFLENGYEFTSSKQTESLYRKLEKRTKIALTAGVVQTIFFLAFAVLQFLAQALSLSKGVLFAVAFLALAVSGMVNVYPFAKAIDEAKERKPGIYVGEVILYILALVQSVLWLTMDDATLKIPLLTVPVLLFMAVISWGEWTKETRVFRNFAFFGTMNKKYSIQEIDNDETVSQIGSDLHTGNPDIRYSAKTNMFSGFIKTAYAPSNADIVGKQLFLPMIVFSVVLSAGFGLYSNNFLSVISLLLCTLCVILPSSFVLSYELPMKRMNKYLQANGSTVTGYNALETIDDMNAVIIDSSDIYAEGGCEIYGIQPFYNMRMDQAILITAALVIEAGGPCGEVFDRVIQGKRELLPTVEDWVYEDKLGLSAWVHDQRVLVGNRELLINHGVAAPSRTQEAQYRGDNRQIMYLAVSGKIAAMYLVGYNPQVGIRELLHEMEQSGVTVLIRTSDANVTEELIANSFGLSLDAIKVISARASDLYMKQYKKTQEEAPADMVHDGDILSLLRTLGGVIWQAGRAPVTRALQIAGSASGFVFIAVLAFLGGFAQLGVLQIVTFQCVLLLLFVLAGNIGLKKL